MTRDVIIVSAETDQEEICRVAERHDLRSVPAVDRAARLIVQITIKHLRRILRDEAGEDLMHMSRVSAKTKPKDSIRCIVAGLQTRNYDLLENASEALQKALELHGEHYHSHGFSWDARGVE